MLFVLEHAQTTISCIFIDGLPSFSCVLPARLTVRGTSASVLVLLLVGWGRGDFLPCTTMLRKSLVGQEGRTVLSSWTRKGTKLFIGIGTRTGQHQFSTSGDPQAIESFNVTSHLNRLSQQCGTLHYLYLWEMLCKSDERCWFWPMVL